MAHKKDSPEKKADVAIWVRLPRNITVDRLKELGIPEVACYGGDTCIAATAPTAEAGLLIQRPARENLNQLLRDAGLNPQAACFGGDTCIV